MQPQEPHADHANAILYSDYAKQFAFHEQTISHTTTVKYIDLFKRKLLAKNQNTIATIRCRKPSS